MYTVCIFDSKHDDYITLCERKSLLDAFDTARKLCDLLHDIVTVHEIDESTILFTFVYHTNEGVILW